MTALRLSLLAGLVVSALSSISWSSEPAPPGTIVQISTPGESAIDPEFLEDPPRMTFQLGGTNEIWLTGVDPLTGDLTTPGGKEILIDTGGAPLALTNNGPEFGVSERGWAIFYCKGGIFDRQIWMAEVGASVTTRRITSGPIHQNQLASKGRGAPTFRVLCVSPEKGSDDVYWFDVDHPEERSFVEVFERGNNPCRWAEGAEFIPARDFDTGQLFLIDTADDSRRVITDDDGYKNDPRGWYAPEYDGELLVYAVSDGRELAVYRDLGGETWKRIASVPIPDESNLDALYSPEPFVVNGKTYLSVGVRAEWTRDREIWILSLDGSYEERCGGDEFPLTRSNPEAFVGHDRVFVYYNLIDGYEIMRYTSFLEVRRTPVCVELSGSESGPALAITKGACGAGDPAGPFDVIRGATYALRFGGGSVDLGRVACVSDDLEVDRVTDDSQDPGAGQASFFLARRASAPDFGVASDGRPRNLMGPSRGCP